MEEEKDLIKEIDEETQESIQEQEPEDSEFNEIFVENEGDVESALFEYCFKHNIPYSVELAKTLASSPKFVEATNRSQIYVDSINNNPKYEGLTFFKQLKKDNFEKIYQEKVLVQDLTDEDRKNRMQVIDILSYDPFKDDDPLDKPQLYRDLAAMLTENMRKDVAKAKAALAVVRNYSNLEKIQKQINDIFQAGAIDEDAQASLEKLQKMAKTIQDSINGTAEKNNFTAKGIGSNGRGMLSDVMNQIEEKGIDLGVTNFYDIETSKSIGEVADISWKSMLNQVNLSKTDYADIIADQSILVREAQARAKDAVEALRLAKEKITKQQLLEELEEDYRSKGISEADIQEFIEREISMYTLDK